MQARLADYLVVLGPNDSGLLRKRRKNNLRANSHAIFPITRVVLESCKRDLSDLPPELEPVLGLDQQPHNFGGMLTRRLSVLCVSRAMCYQEDEDVAPDRKKSMLLQYPITDLILVGKKETPPAGYIQVEGLSLYFSRSQDRDPLIDIVVISTRKAETCPPDFVKVDKSLNPGALGENLFLCYRRSLQGRKAVGFEPELLGCYPTTEHADFKLDFQAVSLLCFPRGIILALEPSLPRFFTFVLTGGDGSEVYGAALIFYEVLGEVDEQQPTRYSAKAMCILSHFPFYQAFRQLLNQLYQVAVSPNTLPIEYWISYFFRKVPIPRPSQQITCLMGHAKLVFHQPPALGFPLLDQPLAPLFTFLKIDNVITLFEHCLGEGKIVLYSNSYEGLTMVLESLRSLLFPLKWQGLFIPILPSNLAYSLRAPVPFLIGLHRTFLHEVRVSEEVLLVDLDRNHLRLPSQKSTPFPTPLRTYLRTQLESFVKLYREGDISQEDNTTFLTSMDGLTQEDCARIRVLFVRVLVVFLADYRKHLRLMEVKANAMLELNEVFDCEAFVGGLRPDFRAFAAHLSKSQMFSDFVINRVLPPSQSMDATRRSQLLYFDWCVALFHAYKDKDQDERGNPVGESVSVSIWPSEVKTDKTPSRGEISSTWSRSRLSIDDDGSVSQGTPTPTEAAHKMSYFQLQIKKATKKMKAVKLLNRSESEEPEFEPDFGKLDVENLDTLSTPRTEVLTLSQPEPDGIERHNYAKFPKVSVELFEEFDKKIPNKPPPLRVTSSSTASNADGHIASGIALTLKALSETPRTLSIGSDNMLTQLLISEIYDSWFFLRTCSESKEDSHLLLLLLLIECYIMVKVTGIPLTEHILADVCLFCARMGMEEYFHLIYRVACQTMPHPNAQFFISLSQHLISKRRPSYNSVRSPERVHRLPECIETFAQCSSCGHELSGTDIIASFIGNPQSLCPMCGGTVTPQLIVWLDRKEHLRAQLLKPSVVKALIHQYWRQVKDQNAADKVTGEESVLNRDLLDLVQADDNLFWSLFWWFASRGSSFGMAELPFSFMFAGHIEDNLKEPIAYTLRTSVWGSWRLIRLSIAGGDVSYWEERLDNPSTRAERNAAVEDLANSLNLPSWKEDLKNMSPKLLALGLQHFLNQRVKTGSSSSEIPRLYDKSLTVQLGVLVDDLRRRELNDGTGLTQYTNFTTGFQEAIEQFLSDIESRMASNQLTGQEVDTEYQRLCELKSQLLPRDLYSSKALFARAALVLNIFTVGPDHDVRCQKDLCELLAYCDQHCTTPQRWYLVPDTCATVAPAEQKAAGVEIPELSVNVEEPKATTNIESVTIPSSPPAVEQSGLIEGAEASQ